MIYKKNKKIIKIIRKQEPKLPNLFYDREDIWKVVQNNKRLEINVGEFISSLETIAEEDFIKFSENSNGTAFRICDKCRYYYEYRRNEILNYIKEKWIDFFALFLSVVSLIISIFSMTTSI